MIMWQSKGRKQARYVCAVAQLVFHVEKGSKVFVPIPETGDPYIFHCLSREVKSSECCFDK